MRPILIATALAAALSAHAGPVEASPRHAVQADVGGHLIEVQNRFLPGFLGGEKKDGADMALRIEQLEAQVRMLTGQVEQLTFTVRRLEAALGQTSGAATPGRQGALTSPEAQPGPGAPPRPLGTITTATPPAVGEPGAVASTAPPVTTPPASGQGGPIDLSALNQNQTALPPVVSQPVQQQQAAVPAPAADALSKVRELQASGRYSMAENEARAVLTANPTGAAATEARFLLGEALLAQRDYRGAANMFLENYTADPTNARAPASLLRLGTALNGLGEREAACSSLEELFGAYPNIDAETRAAAERERAAANCV
ncbi:MAG: hypothetical protein AAGJ94_07270 [Pseudomonadota bacterium]